MTDDVTEQAPVIVEATGVREVIDSEPDDERNCLPFKKDPNDRPSVWKVLKDAVGKDLSKFCVPVYYNEPISMVQKVAEIMEYQDLLKQADM